MQATWFYFFLVVAFKSTAGVGAFPLEVVYGTVLTKFCA